MPQIPINQDEPAVTDAEIWQECNERLRICIEAEGENRSRAERALEFRDGNQWPDDLYNQRKIARRPSLTINHTNTYCNRVVNNMRQQRPRIKVHPVADADIDKANIFAGMIRHIEVRSKASVAYDTGGESSVNIGWGYWRILSEYQDERSFDQEVVILPIRNAFTVYMDPSSVMPAGEDAEWCIITEKMKRIEYARQYPKADNVEFMRTGQGDNTAQWETKTEIRLAEYYRISKVTDTLHQLSNGMTLFETERKKLAAEIQAAHATVVRSRPSYRRTVEWFKVNGRMIVDRRTERKDPLPGRYIPVVRCEGNVLDLNGRIRRKGMVWDLMDPARMYNYWRDLSTDTPVPTPRGWSTIGRLQIGDEVFDENGKPTKIIGKSNVRIKEKCYRITFGDGSKIIAAKDHPWPVEQRGKRTSQSWTWTKERVLTENLVPKKHFIETAKPIECDSAQLPVHPYLLGLWLGDGQSASPRISPGDEDLDEVRDNLTALGYQLGPNSPTGPAKTFGVLGVRHLFRQIGVLGQKHVPKSYLRASVDQRWALLRGFMDSDGSIGKHNKQCSYTTVNPAISEGFRELVRSLGIRLSVIKREGRRSKLVGDSILQPFWQFSFSCYADEPVFGLRRKQQLLPRATEHRRRTKRHSIASVELIESVPLQCLGIDTPTHLFLCGESMIPTHNTAETEQLALASKAPWTGQPEHFDGHPEWDDANQTPYSKLTFNAAFFEQPDGSKTPLPNPQRQAAIEVPAGFVQAAQGAMQDLGAVAGMPHEPSQDTPGVVVSGLALKRREALSDIGHFQFYDKQTLAINHTGVILAEYIPVYYSEARMQRIIGEDGVPSMVPINTPKPAAPADPNAPPPAPGAPPADPAIPEIENDLSVGKFDIVMDTGPGYETKRLEGAESMIDLLKTPLAEPIAKVGADLIVRNMDFAGASDLADRLMPMTPDGIQKTLASLPKSAQGVVTAMSAHIQQLQQKLQEAQMEIKYKTTIEHGWMQVEREKTAEKIKADAANNATKQLDTHVKAVTAHDVAEIGAASKLMDTHAKAGHESVARRETLAAAEKAEKTNGTGE